MTDFFNDFDKVNAKEILKPGTEKTETEIEKTEEKEDFSKTLENLRNEITALKELLKNSSNNNSAEETENKTESEDVEE